MFNKSVKKVSKNNFSYTKIYEPKGEEKNKKDFK